MGLENMPDERLIRFYESVRQKVDADRARKSRFIGALIRQYADQLRNEMIKRRLTPTPTDWPPLERRVTHRGGVEVAAMSAPAPADSSVVEPSRSE